MEWKWWLCAVVGFFPLVISWELTRLWRPGSQQHQHAKAWRKCCYLSCHHNHLFFQMGGRTCCVSIWSPSCVLKITWLFQEHVMVSLLWVSPPSRLSVLLEYTIFVYCIPSSLQANYYFYNHFSWAWNLNAGTSFPIFARSAVCTSAYFTATSDLSSFLPNPFSFLLLVFPFSYHLSAVLSFPVLAQQSEGERNNF